MFEVFSQHSEDSGAENRGMGKGTCTHRLRNKTYMCSVRLYLSKCSSCRNGGEVLPPGGGALLQDPGVHHWEREDDTGRRRPVGEYFSLYAKASYWQMFIWSTWATDWDLVVCLCVPVYPGAGRLPSLAARLLPGDRHLLLQTSRWFPQPDRHLPASSLSLL